MLTCLHERLWFFAAFYQSTIKPLELCTGIVVVCVSVMLTQPRPDALTALTSTPKQTGFGTSHVNTHTHTHTCTRVHAKRSRREHLRQP